MARSTILICATFSLMLAGYSHAGAILDIANHAESKQMTPESSLTSLGMHAGIEATAAMYAYAGKPTRQNNLCDKMAGLCWNDTASTQTSNSPLAEDMLASRAANRGITADALAGFAAIRDNARDLVRRATYQHILPENSYPKHYLHFANDEEIGRFTRETKNGEISAQRFSQSKEASEPAEVATKVSANPPQVEQTVAQQSVSYATFINPITLLMLGIKFIISLPGILLVMASVATAYFFRRHKKHMRRRRGSRRYIAPTQVASEQRKLKRRRGLERFVDPRVTY